MQDKPSQRPSKNEKKCLRFELFQQPEGKEKTMEAVQFWIPGIMGIMGSTSVLSDK